MCLGIPAQIVDIADPAIPLAIVEIGGVRRTVNIAFIVDEERHAEQCLGQWVLVHVGFAMSRLDEQEAERTLSLLSELGDMQVEMAALQASSSADGAGVSVARTAGATSVVDGAGIAGAVRVDSTLRG